MAEAAARQTDRPVILSLAGLTKSFGHLKAVDSIDLEILEGEFLTIVGPSGSGKSTLVRLLAGLEAPSSGTIRLRDIDITLMPANRRPTAMVFQSLALFDHKTVGQNIEFAMKMKGIAPDQRRARAMELLNLVRLPEAYYSRAVTQCSGGERQRVALARAFASDPEILFFDEPLSAIDYRLRKTLEVELKDLHQRTGKTFVYITHSLEEAMMMSDRIAIMRAGRFVQMGAPQEIYGSPVNRFVASFMGEVNMFTVAAGADGTPRLTEIDAPAPGARGAFAVLRPEALTQGRNGEIQIKARVTQTALLGSRTQVMLDARGLPLIAEVPGSPEGLQPGVLAEFSFDLANVAWVTE
ncbi:ABC transporter ATP-binding protein [Tabrizicola sp. BL-A-41-H6]|uniref:ABC transporter ATP-binding protein n=1 Tax=Tabrizicola sp. BL-A-41-H6 TaxID=3421107 RepID=UPI003D67E1EF